MKQQLLAPLRRISLQLLLLLCCYFISRCAFTIINIKQFHNLSLGNFATIALHAIRYDISALLAINAFYILLLLLPFPLGRIPYWNNITQWIFIITNSIALLFEVSDWAYFPYNFKRATADVLNMVSRKGDFWSLLPRFVIDYWYVPLGAAFIIFILIKGNNLIRRITPLYTGKYTLATAAAQTGILLLVAALSLVGIRGGLQYIPIGVRNAVQATEPEYTPIVINTPFSIITTFQNDKLPDVKYFPEAELSKYFNTRKQFANDQFNNKNVVLIIVESFSKEFTKIGSPTSYTPFIDSLMDHSFVCTQAYANALHSAEGIPAIIAGIPSLMDEPVSTSIYNNNHFTTLPNVLKLKGYSSAFYHGGTNGTMSFDVFCASAGYDKYYGRSEYNNEEDYDGNWGIWDEPFLQFFAHGISNMKQPFFATVFTLSSHPPYKIPEKYINQLPEDSLPIHRCIAYTDIALRRFFETASRQSWYNNTLFIITADHCSPMSAIPYYQHNMGAYAIPLIYYAPGDAKLKGYNNRLTQHIDILPSVLDYLGYSDSVFAFGNSVFRHDTRPYAINYISNSHQLVIDSDLLQTINLQPRGLYQFPLDSICNNNLLQKYMSVAQPRLHDLKAFIQIYNSALINNNMWINTSK